jgi:hypothetical protein
MINEVRNTVLSILNKNNYGYISPSDFNLYAMNAQMEVYKQYYSDYNKIINAENARVSGTDYADIESPLAETLESFLVDNYLANIAGNIFSVPTLTTVGNEAYYILKVLCFTESITSGQITSAASNQLNDSSATFITDGISAGYIVTNVDTGTVSTVLSVTSQTSILLSSNIFPANGADYKIFSNTSKEAEKVSVGKIGMLNSSNLTQPNNSFPAYTLEGQNIKVYPNTIDTAGQVQAVYFRFPKVPKWTYITLANGEPVFDQSQSDYQDFELPQEELYVLVTKILQYCGVSIRETEVAQFAIAQEAAQEATFSPKQ